MSQAADMTQLCEYLRVTHNRPPLQEDIPEVFVKVKVYHVVRVREVDQKYEADFTLMLDWVDPSVAHKVRFMGREDAHAYDLAGHFLPEVLVDNAVNDDVQPVGGPQQPRLEFGDESWKEGHVKMTQRYRIEINQQYHVEKFPFDKQTLQIVFKSRSVNILGHTFQVELLDGRNSPREDFEHAIDKRWRLEDWVTLGIHGTPTKAQHEKKNRNCNDMYIVGIDIMREPSTGFWMFLFPLLTTGLLSLTAYGAPPGDVGDRESVVVTLVLTVTAFKFVLSNSIPPVAYLTDVDKLIIYTTCLLILQGFMFVVAAVVERNIPDTYTHYNLSSGRLVDITLGGIIGLLSLGVQYDACMSYYDALGEKEKAAELLSPDEHNPVLIRSQSMEKPKEVVELKQDVIEPTHPVARKLAVRSLSPRRMLSLSAQAQRAEHNQSRDQDQGDRCDAIPDHISDTSTDAETEYSVQIVDEPILVHQPFSNGSSPTPTHRQPTI